MGATEDKKRVLVVRSNVIWAPGDIEKVHDDLVKALETGVVILPPAVSYCCMVNVDGVSIMVDDAWPCDPDKATGCRKTECHRYGGDCYLTTNHSWRRY